MGGDLQTYIGAKQEALGKFGFGDSPYEVVTTFNGLTEAGLIDAFLGLKQDIPDTRIEVSETRFDIRLDEPPAAGTLRIEPSPSDSCVVSYQASPIDLPISFRGDLIRAPRLGRLVKIRIRGKLIDIVVKVEEQTINAS